MMLVLQYIGAIISLLLGLLALLFPNKVELFVSVKSIGKEGRSEIRATYGGFFFGISLFAILSQNQMVYITLGVGWLSAALIRLITLFFGNYTANNLTGVFFEALIGLLCVSSYFINY